MDDYRSKYYGEGDMQIQPYQGGGAGVSGGGGRNYSQQGGHGGGGDFRSYSTSATYVSSSAVTTTGGGGGGNNKDLKFKKAKSGGTSKIWCFNDPELQRKKRVASYKVYSVEGNIKGTFRKVLDGLKIGTPKLCMVGGDQSINQSSSNQSFNPSIYLDQSISNFCEFFF